MRVKNRSDLEEFPDGDRATLVRRYSPALTRRQLCVLTRCPYDTPGIIGPDDSDRRSALALVRYGLLERDPTSACVFRVTPAGAEVVHRWTWAGFMATTTRPNPL